MAEIFELEDNLVINHHAPEWCKLPYPRHPKGCKNYDDNKDGCPPCENVEDYFDLEKDQYFIVVRFDLGEHARKLIEKDPVYWTVGRSRCVLYWQQSVKKQLRDAFKEFRKQNGSMIVHYRPEALGVQVISTAKKLGIPIDVKPVDIIYKIAMVGYPKNVETPKITQKRLIDFKGVSE